MLHLRVWPRGQKEENGSHQEQDAESNISQFLATADSNKKHTPQRWSTIPGSQARGPISRVPLSLPPQQTSLIDQIEDLSIHRLAESTPGSSSSAPALTHAGTSQSPRIPVPAPAAQYLPEAPGSDIHNTGTTARSQSNGPQYSGSYAHLTGVATQLPKNLVQAGHLPVELDEISVEGRTYRYIFPSHEFVAKPHIEVEGNPPANSEVVPSGLADRNSNPGVSSQSHPVELSADIPLVGKSTPPPSISQSFECGPSLQEPDLLEIKTDPTQEPNTMNLPDAGTVPNNQPPLDTACSNSSLPVLPIQFHDDVHEPLFDIQQFRASASSPEDHQNPTTSQNEPRATSITGPDSALQAPWVSIDSGSPFSATNSHQHHDQDVEPAFPRQSLPAEDNREEDKGLASGPQIQALAPPTFQRSKPLEGFIQGGGLNPKVELLKQQRPVEIPRVSSSMSPQGTARLRSRPHDHTPSGHDTLVQQGNEPIQVQWSPQPRPGMVEIRMQNHNSQGHFVPQPSIRPTVTNYAPSQTHGMQQIIAPRRDSSLNSAAHPGVPYNSGMSVGTHASPSKQSHNVLIKSAPVPDPTLKENATGIKKVVKKMFGGNGGTTPITYSPEEMTRRCLDFMEQYNIPPDAALDPFSNILVYARGKWSHDEHRIHAQNIEMKNLADRKERYKSELESARRELHLMTLHRDDLRRELRAAEGKLNASQELLRGFQDSFDRQVEFNNQLNSRLQELENQNIQLFRKGQEKIQELQDTISAKDQAFMDMKAVCQKEINTLQNRIVKFGEDGFRFVVDDKFQRKLDIAAQKINKLVSYVPRPPPGDFDTSLDINMFLHRNEQFLGSRVWAKFIFGTCWGVLQRAFFSSPLGFGIFGAEGEGFVIFNHIREILSVHGASMDKPDISNDRQTNEVRGFIFQRIWEDAAANTTVNSTSSTTGEKGAKSLSLYFYQHLDMVTTELLSILARCSTNSLDPLAPPMIRELVRDIGFLALEMATQRAHLALEFCIHGDVIQQGKHFKDEMAGDGALGTARVDLMTEPALTRLGNGRNGLTEYKVLRQGTFVTLRNHVV